MTGCALVTGAGSRLGRDMAIHLGQRGFDVAVHYAGNADGAEETAAAIRAMGAQAVVLQADLVELDAAEGDAPAGCTPDVSAASATRALSLNLSTGTPDGPDGYNGSSTNPSYYLCTLGVSKMPVPSKWSALGLVYKAVEYDHIKHELGI